MLSVLIILTLQQSTLVLIVPMVMWIVFVFTPICVFIAKVCFASLFRKCILIVTTVLAVVVNILQTKKKVVFI